MSSTENPELNIIAQSKSDENTNFVDYIQSDDSQTSISIDFSNGIIAFFFFMYRNNDACDGGFGGR